MSLDQPKRIVRQQYSYDQKKWTDERHELDSITVQFSKTVQAAEAIYTVPTGFVFKVFDIMIYNAEAGANVMTLLDVAVKKLVVGQPTITNYTNHLTKPIKFATTINWQQSAVFANTSEITLVGVLEEL